MVFFRKLTDILFKINIIRYFYQLLRYKVRLGNYVNFRVDGKLEFESPNIVIRDFSEIVVEQNGELKISKNVFLGKNVEIGAKKILIHSNTSIQNNCILLGCIEIGANCLFGPSVYVSSGFHHFRYKPELLIKDQDTLANEEYSNNKNQIIIEEDVWIGKNVVIINNVTIGKGAVIGANTIINKSVSPYTIVAGSPQKIIGNRLDFFKNIPIALNGNDSSHFPYFYSGFDYSIESIKTNKYVAIINSKVTFYLNNTFRKGNLSIEFETLNGEIKLNFLGTKKIIERDKVSFLLPSDILIEKYSLDIDGKLGLILIKEIYFED